jgi:hypothetical protein
MDIAQMLRTFFIVVIALCATVLAGCESAKPKTVSDGSIMQKTDNSPEIHGEVGAMYGSGNLSGH